MRVVNNSKCVVFVKPELLKTAERLEAGKTYEGAQDGVAVPKSNPGHVYKSTNGVDLTITADGQVIPSGTVAQFLETLVLGMWKDSQFLTYLHLKKDDGWDALFATSRTKPECCNR